MNILMRFAIYGALGCLIEVFWTGGASLLSRNFTLRANTSLWMFAIYGMVIALEPMFRAFAFLPLPLRGLLYAACIMSGEFATGSLLRLAHLCPWDYSHTRFHIRGLVRWDYLPAWAIAGLFFERLYGMIV